MLYHWYWASFIHNDIKFLTPLYIHTHTHTHTHVQTDSQNVCTLGKVFVFSQIYSPVTPNTDNPHQTVHID